MSASPDARRIRREALVAGHLRAIPTGIATGIWGIVTGVAMVNSGLTAWQAVGMTLFVFAGSAQLAVLPLIVAQAPIWVILLTAAAVNLRFVIFSAGLVPYLRKLPLAGRMLLGFSTGDFGYAISIAQWMRQPPEKRGAPEQIWFMIGSNLTTWLVWQISSLAGIALGAQIPPSWGLDFAVLAASAPLKLGLIAAVAAGSAAAMALDIALEKR